MADERRNTTKLLRTMNSAGKIKSILCLSMLGILTVECRHENHRHMKFPDSFSNSSLPPESKSDSKGVFVQIPHSNPPTVRPPPYTISHDKCPAQNMRENWIDTLCGDLNTGQVPQNPLGHKFSDGGTYPFETIKNKTLEFFRRALPILKSDKSLPKVAKYATGGNFPLQPPTEHLYRAKRGVATREPGLPDPLLFDASYPDSYYYDDPAPAPSTGSRQRRQHGPLTGVNGGGNGFCENRVMGYYNRLCKLYNAMWGKTPHNIQRDASGEIRRHHGHGTSPRPNYNHFSSPHPQHHHQKKHFRQAFHSRPDSPVGGGGSDWPKTSKHLHTGASNSNPSTAQLPPTPCPSAAEYLTPVFARNHEGAWRYVVQIPKEGYFTQTVEVTKCLQSTCYYMEGSCKTSPRWQSLLVAELFYPDTTFPTTARTTTSTKRPSLPFVSDSDSYPDYLYSKGSASIENGGSSYSNELGLPFKKRSIRSVKESKNSNSQGCDGYDDVGCYQVRLFYDWFLIPGSCKCWKRQFDFTRV